MIAVTKIKERRENSNFGAENEKSECRIRKSSPKSLKECLTCLPRQRHVRSHVSETRTRRSCMRHVAAGGTSDQCRDLTAAEASKRRNKGGGQRTSGGTVRCSHTDGNGSVAKRTTLHDLYEKEGQSPWYDNLYCPVTDLLPLIASGVRGVTSNPAIFQKAISSSNAYNDQFRELVQAGKDIESAYWELVVKNIQDACKLFESIYDQIDGGDGYVSVEVSPKLADDTKGTIQAAKWLHKVVNRPNVYIKIPATAPCIPSIKEVIANGISVNVTLIFSLARYEAVITASNPLIY
ncbi:uncharacterized protein LOC107489812 [Arachis duranensis]|uniref:Uncharacterized protein LOC107489812 n=1 Tax=Arachis duranensis TaxID=130453 RepID=A0A6P5NRU2_ARADU|nr:uncharacterized protein LOC107489812 [Arachis duranensis]